MGNLAPIAYGGYAIALAIHAAYKTTPDGFHLHSAFGHYLRPVSTEANLICTPVKLRQSKGFITYRVAVEQNDPSTGQQRLCMELLADFHRDEQSVLTFSSQPTRSYSHWQDCRPCPEGITTQNLMGMAKTVKTSQEELSPTAKSSADWLRVKHPLRTEGEEMASLGFIMDGVLSFLPLAHNYMSFEDAGVCSSLDFALRIFAPRPKMEQWHLREIINHHAGNGRTYTILRWETWFPNSQILTEDQVILKPLPANGQSSIDSFSLFDVDVVHFDTNASSFLHIPDIGLVVAGDIVYGDCFQFLAEPTKTEKRNNWFNALDQIAALSPNVVVPGHKRASRADGPYLIESTRQYILAFEEDLSQSSDSDQVEEAMMKRYPQR
ncbi:Acyl-CoA thioesterase [Penicillium expansum]|nr:Acyl-CoA thioesterase [Penicillium expansum]